MLRLHYMHGIDFGFKILQQATKKLPKIVIIFLVPFSESAKLYTLRAKNMLWCQRALYAYVPTCPACLCAHVPTCLASLCGHVPTCLPCLCAHVLMCLACSRANVSCVLPCLCVNVPSSVTLICI